MQSQEQTRGRSRALKGHPSAANVTGSPDVLGGGQGTDRCSGLLFGSGGLTPSSDSRERGEGFAEVG